MSLCRIIGIILGLGVLPLLRAETAPGTALPVCIPGSSLAPCATRAWDFAFYGLYLQPNYGDKLFYFGSVGNSSLAEQITKNPIDWAGGYRLESAFHFGTGQDISINWYHFDQKIKNVFELDTSPFNFFVQIHYKIKPQWDSVNLELGQILNIGFNKSLRFNAGVQFAELITKGSMYSTPIVLRRSIRYLSANGALEFQGIGPRLGIDFYSMFRNNFGFYANAAATVLVGNSEFHRSDYLNDVRIDKKKGSKNLTVPEIEVKGGLQYVRSFDQNLISFNIGYMLVSFLSDTDFFKSSGRIFTLNGPYAGIKWVGAV